MIHIFAGGLPRVGGRRSALVAIVLLASLPVIAFIPGSGAAECTVDQNLVNSCRPWLGANTNKYPDAGSGPRAQIEYHEQRIGRRVDIAHTYHPVGSNKLSPDDKYFAARSNTMLFTNWKPTDKWSKATGGDVATNKGIDDMADHVKSVAPNRIFMTIHHEPENDVSGGALGCDVTYKGSAGTPDEYRAMWRNVQQRFAAKGIDNVVWVMDYMNYAPWDCLVDDLWPGNDLVDWVMFNAYDDPGKATSFTTRVERFQNVLLKYDDKSHAFTSKPWGIVEWNASGEDATLAYRYYDQAKAAVETNAFPRIKAYMVFDSVGPEGSENRIAYINGKFDAEKQKRYATFANSPKFSSASSGLPPATTTPPTTVKPPVTTPTTTKPPVTTPTTTKPPVTTPPATAPTKPSEPPPVSLPVAPPAPQAPNVPTNPDEAVQPALSWVLEWLSSWRPRL